MSKLKHERRRGTPTKYFKNCSSCNDIIYFCNKYGLLDSIDENRECAKCCKTGNKNPQFGRIYTEKEKQKFGELVKNSEKYQMYHKSGKSAEISRNMILNRISKFGNPIGFNKNACKFFDTLNKKLKWKGKHALNNDTKMEHKVLGYLLDYYEPNLNLVIEWDEERHYYRDGSLKEKDLIRQKNLINHLNCKFYRIREKTYDVYKYDNLPEDLTKVIKNILIKNKRK
jgi:hypothetical protein